MPKLWTHILFSQIYQFLPKYMLDKKNLEDITRIDVDLVLMYQTRII